LEGFAAGLDPPPEVEIDLGVSLGQELEENPVQELEVAHEQGDLGLDVPEWRSSY
jgi:hypothetical protein